MGDNSAHKTYKRALRAHDPGFRAHVSARTYDIMAHLVYDFARITDVSRSEANVFAQKTGV